MQYLWLNENKWKKEFLLYRKIKRRKCTLLLPYNGQSSGDTRCAGCNMHRFGEVQAHRTSSNLLELHPHRDSKVYRVLLHEFGVVRLYRTFSNYISSGKKKSAVHNQSLRVTRELQERVDPLQQLGLKLVVGPYIRSWPHPSLARLGGGGEYGECVSRAGDLSHVLRRRVRERGVWKEETWKLSPNPFEDQER